MSVSGEIFSKEFLTVTILSDRRYHNLKYPASKDFFDMGIMLST